MVDTAQPQASSSPADGQTASLTFLCPQLAETHVEAGSLHLFSEAGNRAQTTLHLPGYNASKIPRLNGRNF